MFVGSFMIHHSGSHLAIAPIMSRIGRRELGYRCDLNAGFPRNHPHFNPGPGGYQPRSVYKGGKTDPGADAPQFMFGQGPKLMSPEKSFSATVFISNVRQMLCSPYHVHE